MKTSGGMMRAYEYRHIVSFEETNLVGNVYYVNYLSWQGRCRELFLREHAPSALKALEHGMALVTTRCACEYLEELVAFDEVIVRMRLKRTDLTQNRIGMLFEYYKCGGGERLVARGEQQVVCMERDGARLRPAPLPKELRDALQLYLTE